MLRGALRSCLWGLALVFAAAPVAAAEPVRIGILLSQDSAPYQEVMTGFRQLLDKNGVRAAIEVHALQGDEARARAAARQETGRRAQLLFAVGTLAVQAARREAPSVPLVAGMILSAEELKGAANATGVVLELPLETELDWLRRLLPEQKNIGVLYSPAINPTRISEAKRLGAALGVRVHARRVEAPRDLPAELDHLASQAEVLWGLADPVVLNQQTAQSLLLFSYRNRIPFVGLSRSWVKAGALYALERDYQDIGRQCGVLGLKILHGAPAGSLRPETPYKIGYILNLKTAQHMKIDFPAALVKGALEVIE
jgi:putative ABC transport system substrate-binding protein